MSSCRCTWRWWGSTWWTPTTFRVLPRRPTSALRHALPPAPCLRARPSSWGCILDSLAATRSFTSRRLSQLMKTCVVESTVSGSRGCAPARLLASQNVSSALGAAAPRRRAPLPASVTDRRVVARTLCKLSDESRTFTIRTEHSTCLHACRSHNARGVE